MAAQNTEPLYVKPAPGRLIRHPYSMRVMPEEGFEVKGELRGYWHRMLRAGDLVVIPPPHKAPKPEP